MTARRIIDAGPALNFFSINKERLLLSVVGTLSAPEVVEAEVLRKARTDRRFAAAAAVWSRVRPNFIEILADVESPELAAVVSRLCGVPMAERTQTARDLGETMVIAHAVTLAERSEDITIIIDEQRGAELASLEAQRLDRLRVQGKPVGALSLVNTVTILKRAAGGTYLPDREAMRRTYTRLRERDDGLMPIDRTGLLATELWT